MWSIMRQNQQGFVLAETLVVAVAVMGIFSLLYANYYPLIGEYEKREVYDDLDSKYVAHWVRKILVDKSLNQSNITIMPDCGGNCNIIYAAYYEDHYNSATGAMVREKKSLFRNASDGEDKIESIAGDNSPYLQNYITAANIRAVIVTKYNINTFKNYVKNNETIATSSQQSLINQHIFNRGFREYIDYLPKYSTASSNGANYRVIVIIDHNTSKEYDSYGTIEVKL